MFDGDLYVDVMLHLFGEVWPVTTLWLSHDSIMTYKRKEQRTRPKIKKCAQ